MVAFRMKSVFAFFVSHKPQRVPGRQEYSRSPQHPATAPSATPGGQATGKWDGDNLTVPFELYKGQRIPSNLWSVLDQLGRLDTEEGPKTGWY